MQPARAELYPTDVSGEEWAFVAPHLALLPEGAPRHLPALLAGLHFVAFACLMVAKAAPLIAKAA